MNNKELYRIWAPSEADKWTRFAKPAMFVHTNSFAFLNKIEAANIPPNITQLNNKETAFIVDLPAETSVVIGLGLAKNDFRLVPLYNGIHETKIGALDPVINNQPIVDALISGADVLKNLRISTDAPPVFLLDSRRDLEITSSDNLYDNRWSIDFEDMPAASYMKSAGINRVVIWGKKDVKEDLVPIINSYQDVGIEILTFIDGKMIESEKELQASLSHKKTQLSQSFASDETSAKVTSQTKELVRKFENARFGLMLITILAFINLFFMFFVMDAPLLYTAPSLMWMTYLFLSYGMANFLAIVIPVIFLILYLKSQKNRYLMVAALIFFGIDLLVFYIYAIFIYGIGAFTEGYFYYGVLVFIPPVWLISFLISGVRAEKELKGVNEISYLKHLDQLDKMPPCNNPRGRVRVRSSRFRGYRDCRGNYRGYSGYGGTGSGGYSGSGYRGSGGGGYRGGFGG